MWPATAIDLTISTDSHGYFLDFANSDNNAKDEVIRGLVTSDDRGVTSVRIN